MSKHPYEVLERAAGVRFFDYQRDALALAASLEGPQQRLCLYYKTGAGKTLTALACLAQWGAEACVAVAPPATHPAWEAAGALFGIKVETMSHAKFRMKATLLSRTKPIIADEFHLFGGHRGQGWKKLDRVAVHLQAPMVLASATPNYNDAERVYCIQHVLDPASVKGGFISFLYAHCETRANQFNMTPDVVGFRNHKDAASYLAALPNVAYLADDLVYQIIDLPVRQPMFDELEIYGFNNRADRIIASQIEERHARVNLGLVDDDGGVRDSVFQMVRNLQRTTPLLVFAAHSTVADAFGLSLSKWCMNYAVVTGETSQKKKLATIKLFNSGGVDVLVGTASLATGTDGMDQVCDCLVILDDTDDDALRRQLIGRIMPRGASSSPAAMKRVYRVVLT